MDNPKYSWIGFGWELVKYNRINDNIIIYNHFLIEIFFFVASILIHTLMMWSIQNFADSLREILSWEAKPQEHLNLFFDYLYINISSFIELE